MARNDRNEKQDQEVELIDRLVGINRVAKVVKGGRRFAFAALVVVGDGKGRVGMGTGKAREVPEAISKATEQAKRSMLRVHLREGRTVHHDVIGRFGAGRVQLRSAEPGTGIIAGGPLRAVFEALGIQDVVAKSLGSANPYNMVKAALSALTQTESPRMVASRRNRKVSDILGRGTKSNSASDADTSSDESSEVVNTERKAPAKKSAPAKKNAAKGKKE